MLSRCVRYLFLLVFASSVSWAYAGNPSYIENSAKLSGKLVVPQFNFPGKGVFSVQMDSSAGFLLEPGLKLKVIRLKPVKSLSGLPGTFNPADQRLFIPALVKKQVDVLQYYNVALVQGEGGVDSLGFPLEFVVDSIEEMQLEPTFSKFDENLCVRVDVPPGDGTSYYFKWHLDKPLIGPGLIVSLPGVRVGYSGDWGNPRPLVATAVVRGDGNVDLNYCNDCVIRGMNSRLEGTYSGNTYTEVDCALLPSY